MAQSDLDFSKESILAHWSEENDTCAETPEDEPLLYQLKSSDEEIPFPVVNKRTMPRSCADQGIAYIRACVAEVPFNIRWTFALPMWHRFCEEWDATGDIEKALRAI